MGTPHPGIDLYLSALGELSLPKSVVPMNQPSDADTIAMEVTNDVTGPINATDIGNDSDTVRVTETLALEDSNPRLDNEQGIVDNRLEEHQNESLSDADDAVRKSQTALSQEIPDTAIDIKETNPPDEPSQSCSQWTVHWRSEEHTSELQSRI